MAVPSPRPLLPPGPAPAQRAGAAATGSPAFPSCSARRCFSVGKRSFRGTTPALQTKSRGVHLVSHFVVFPAGTLGAAVPEALPGRSPPRCVGADGSSGAGAAHPARAATPASLLREGRRGHLVPSGGRAGQRGIRALPRQRCFPSVGWGSPRTPHGQSCPGTPIPLLQSPQFAFCDQEERICLRKGLLEIFFLQNLIYRNLSGAVLNGFRGLKWSLSIPVT